MCIFLYLNIPFLENDGVHHYLFIYISAQSVAN